MNGKTILTHAICFAAGALAYKAASEVIYILKERKTPMKKKSKKPNEIDETKSEIDEAMEKLEQAAKDLKEEFTDYTDAVKEYNNDISTPYTRKEPSIEIIPGEKYGKVYPTAEFTYYEDGILVDADGDVVHNMEDIFGETVCDMLDIDKNDAIPSRVYVRNHSTRTDYLVETDEELYSDIVEMEDYEYDEYD